LTKVRQGRVIVRTGHKLAPVTTAKEKQETKQNEDAESYRGSS